MNDLDVCRQAILNEEEGAAFYALAAEKTADDDVKEAFLFLMEEEKLHSKWLRSLYDRLVFQVASANLEWETLAEFEFNREAELSKQGRSPEIFAQNKDYFNLTINDIAVFAAGAFIEKASIEFYQNAQQNAQSEDARKLYEKLVIWEKDHLDELNRIHKALSEEWLNQQEFTHSPQL